MLECGVLMVFVEYCEATCVLRRWMKQDSVRINMAMSVVLGIN
jgi:hypothetical protein